ncbi:hypothetical protein CQY21_02385 [Mycolicibacterium boenickei]|nr:hypothetical protein CQY21_02385 [Mycolicibacterium boenickei]
MLSVDVSEALGYPRVALFTVGQRFYVDRSDSQLTREVSAANAYCLAHDRDAIETQELPKSREPDQRIGLAFLARASFRLIT